MKKAGIASVIAAFEAKETGGSVAARLRHLAPAANRQRQGAVG